MRYIPVIVLLILAVLLQDPLWFGKGSWRNVYQLQVELNQRKANNARLEARNAEMEAEVKDLKSGNVAIEELARYDLGYIKPNEIYVQIPKE